MGRAIPSKSSVQFSVVGRAYIPSLLFDLRPNYDGGNVDNGDLLALPHSVPPIMQQATTKPRLRQRLSDTHGQVGASLLRGHCSFLLGPGAHKVLFVPSKTVFPQSGVKF